MTMQFYWILNVTNIHLIKYNSHGRVTEKLIACIFTICFLALILHETYQLVIINIKGRINKVHTFCFPDQLTWFNKCLCVASQMCWKKKSVIETGMQKIRCQAQEYLWSEFQSLIIKEELKKSSQWPLFCSLSQEGDCVAWWEM